MADQTKRTIRDCMTPNPRTIDLTSTALEAARIMRDDDIGPVIVVDAGQVCGIITDRDITVRAVAEGKDPSATVLSDIYTKDLTTISPDDSVDQAIQIMQDKAIRRLPVVEGSKPIGIVSLGELAIDADGERALAGISASPPNN